MKILPHHIHLPSLCRSLLIPPRSAAFSTCGKHLAVGGNNGKLKIMKSDTLQPICGFANAVSGITVLKYSPNNKILACGSHDLIIHIYDTGMRPGKEETSAAGTGAGTVRVCTHWEKDVGGMGCEPALREHPRLHLARFRSVFLITRC